MAIMNVTYMSRYLRRHVDFQVILPIEDTRLQDPQFVKKPEKFKTLYLLHGYSGNASSWVQGSRIFKIARDRNLAVVMPAGENSFYIDNEESGIMMSSYVGQELVEITRKMFPLSSRREDTLIAGLSMGGFGSLLVGSKFSDTFGGIVALSGPVFLPKMKLEEQLLYRLSVSPRYFQTLFGDEEIVGSKNDPLTQLLIRHQQRQLPRLYIACGTEDYVYENVLAYTKILKEQQVEFTYEDASGEHEWTFWDPFIEKAIDWFYKESQE